MKKYFLIVILPVILQGKAITQVLNPVKWSYSTEKSGDDQVYLVFKASIDKGWHLYGLNMPEGGPIATTFIYADITGFELLGKPEAVIKPEVKHDDILDLDLETLETKGLFRQKVKILSDKNITISGYLEYMACNDRTCTPPIETGFTFFIKGAGKSSAENAVSVDQHTNSTPQTAVPAHDSVREPAEIVQAENEPSLSEISGSTPESENAAPHKSVLITFLISLAAGLGALLTPCVYPMIPMTVSYFMRGKQSKAQGIAEAFVYGISIVLIYTMLGVLVAIFKDPNAVNTVSTHWISNTLFFIVFVILAASFFGMFELVLPASLANRIDKQADRGGFAGAFFMALGMTILSFSCTGPIVASLLIKASEGAVIEPVIGMFGFGLVFAIPFTLFAIFPSWLKSLPKSGNWLNSVKVFIAFILLAFSIYFLSKIDQVYNLNILSREFFIGFWIVVFTLLGLYLLGKIRFPHETGLEHIGIPRFFLTVIVFSFVMYLIPGLFGADLRTVAPLIPPKSSQQFDLSQQVYSESAATDATNELCGTPKYSDFLELPLGLKGYFDYDQSLACAKEKNKPVLLDFAGHACANCKKMYQNVWSDERVLTLLRKKFIIAALYTDDRTKLPQDEWYISPVDGKSKKMIGQQNVDLEIRKFNSNAMPLYAIVDPDGNILTKDPFYVYHPSIEKFRKFLEEGLANFK